MGWYGVAAMAECHDTRSVTYTMAMMTVAGERERVTVRM